MSNIKASKLVSKYEVEVGEGILCNPGDPNYIDL